MNNIRIIGAGAGSGKTYRLASEVYEAIKKGTKPESILLTTFTKKAAEELRSRVTGHLIESGMFQQAQEIRQARMGTVNAVCGSIVEHFALEAGLPPGQKVIDENQASILFRSALSRVLDHKSLAELNHLSYKLNVTNTYTRKDWKDVVNQIAGDARSNGITPEDLPEWGRKSAALSLQTEEPASDDGLEELVSEAKNVLSLAGSIFPDVEKAQKTVQTALKSLKDFISGTSTGWFTWQDLMKLTTLDAGKRGDAGIFNDKLAPFRDMASRFTRWKSFRKDIAEYITLVFCAASEALEQYAAMKKESGVIDFADQEVLCLKLLEDKTICERLKEQLDLVLIDEFQDTSPVQLALFLKFSALCPDSIWVGDPKQSIYMFRGAEPGLMLEAFRKFHKSDSASRQGTNYRSRPALVHFVNSCFRDRFLPQGMAPADVVLEPNREEGELASPALESWVLNGKNKNIHFAGIASRISEMFQSPENYMVIDPSTKRTRNIEYRDVGVMFRSNKHCSEFAGILREFGIPTELASAGLLQLAEIKTLLAGLRLILNPRNTLAAAELTFFRDVMLQEKEETLWLTGRIREYRDSRFNVWEQDETVKKFRNSNDPCALPVSTAVKTAIGLSGLKDFIKHSASPRASLANLEQFTALAQQYESSGQGVGLAGFFEFLNDLESRSKDEKAASGGNAVTICTWHKSKGLEWPMVILGGLDKHITPGLGIQVLAPYDCARAGQPAGEMDVENPLQGRGLLYLLNPFNERSINHPWVQSLFTLPEYENRRKALEAEHLRMLYVGFTRARDYLIFTGQKGSISGLTVPSAESAEPEMIFPLPQDETDVPDGWVVRNLPEVQAPAQSGETGPDTLSNLWFPYTDSDVPRPAAECAPSSLELQDHAGSEVSIAEIVVIGTPVTLKGNPELSELGEAVHGYMAVDTSQMRPSQRLAVARRVLQNRRMDNHLEPEDLVRQKEAMAEYIIKKWPHARWRPELALSMEYEGRTVNGYADLVLELDNGLIIIDHKSMKGKDDYLKTKALAFSPQLAAYSHAAAQAHTKPVLKTFIHYSIEGKMVEVVIKDPFQTLRCAFETDPPILKPV